MPLSITLRLNTLLLVLLVLMGAAIIGMLAMRVEGGPLDPPGAPASSMKTLQEVEPRTPISSVPYTITQPGSYYLTQNVTMAGAGYAITINVANVTLDLGGFTIDGANLGNKGVFANFAATGLTIRNGTVVRMTGTGFDAQTGALLEDVHANNNQTGILVRGTLRNCSARDNTSDGVDAYYSTVSDCFTQTNQVGFYLDASRLSNCAAEFNTTGILMFEASSVQDCAVRGGTTGIYVSGSSASSGGSTVRRNTIQSAGGDGIYVPGWNSYIEGNTVSKSGVNGPGSGINVSGQRNRIDSNHVNDNASYGIVVNIGSGNVIVRNWADANVTDYFFGAGNDGGPVQAPGAATSPWANLTH